jgi:hypothetical protein
MSVLQSTSLYYRALVCTSLYYSVLQAVSGGIGRYQAASGGIGEASDGIVPHRAVLGGIWRYPPIACTVGIAGTADTVGTPGTTEYSSAIQSTSLYYNVLFCTTEY